MYTGESTMRSMYDNLSEKLYTPKSQSDKSRQAPEQQRLLSSQWLHGIKATYEQSPKTFDDAIQAAIDVGELVRHSLKFASAGAGTPLFSPEQLAEDTVTNCHGYSIVASECLEHIGVEHFIGYANQHAFVMLLSDDGRRSFLIDTPNKELYQETTDAIVGVSPRRQLEEGQLRSVNMLNMQYLINHLPASVNRDVFVSKRPWLSFADVDSQHYRDGNVCDTSLQLLLYPSIPGRQLLWHLHDAKIYQARSDAEQAATLLDELPGIYPDIDRRNKVEEVDALTRRLIRMGMGDCAIELAKVFAASLPSDETSSVRFFLGDTLRRVARHDSSGNGLNLQQNAIETYDRRLFEVPSEYYGIVGVPGRWARSDQPKNPSIGFQKLRRRKIQKARDELREMMLKQGNKAS